MIKIAHEAPIDLFDEVQRLTDYDYALVHLLEENSRYRDTFEHAVKKGREVILDNSIFELEEAFDADRFAYWIKELKPTWYIVPDALEQCFKTCDQMHEFFKKYPKESLPGKAIGVVQGKTYESIASCYDYMDKIAPVDMIAISFDYSYYEVCCPHPNKYISWMLGRAKLLGDLESKGVINKDKPHHLLGCGVPQEFMLYRESNYDWLYSLDTSNPVVHGIKGIRYSDQGLWNKESQKLFEMINQEVNDSQIEIIKNNIQKFRWFTNGQNVDSIF